MAIEPAGPQHLYAAGIREGPPRGPSHCRAQGRCGGRAAAAFLILFLLFAFASPSAVTARRVTAIAAGGGHSLALLDDGTVRAWGLDHRGQTDVPRGLVGGRQIGAGGDFSVALLSNGSVAVFGEGVWNQTRVPPGIQGHIREVAVYAWHTLALLSNGSIVGFGDNTYGQSDGPSSVWPLRQLSAGRGGFNLVLLANGTVAAWGDDSSGQCKVPNLGPSVQSVSAGGDHAIALLANGSVVVWGSNQLGQRMLPPNLPEARQIAAGYYCSLVLLRNGSIVAAGDNSFGVLNVPPFPPGRRPLRISAGFAHALALMDDGGIIGWGWNHEGQATVPEDLRSRPNESLVPTSLVPTLSSATSTFATTFAIPTTARTIGTEATMTLTLTSSSATASLEPTLGALGSSTTLAGPPVGAIIGGIVGAVLVLLAIGGLLWWRSRRRTRARGPDPYSPEDAKECSDPQLDAKSTTEAKLADSGHNEAPDWTLIASSATAVASNALVSSSRATSVPAVTEHFVVISGLRTVQASDIQVDESRKLGEGGFGTVHVGLLRGSVPVAVKRIKGGMDESTLRSFRKEVQAWTGLVQRNVLPLMAVCLDPPMMVTDLVECGNLRQFLSQRDWDVRIALALLLDVSHGMAYIHSEGIVHGDLKPQNILVDRGNRAMVTDFGLARLQRETTTTATPGTHAPGTLAYLAPEVLGGSRPRKPADVYSFAMTAYEALGGGCKPFAGIPTEAVAFQVLANRRPARLHELTQDAWALCEDCWTHAAKERPTFAELVPRLASLQDRQAGP